MIEDDGRGVSSEAATGHGMGLRTMRYRAALIGGKLDVGPAASGGTRVVCRWAVRTRGHTTPEPIGGRADGHQGLDCR